MESGPRTVDGEQYVKEGRKGTQHWLRESTRGLRQLHDLKDNDVYERHRSNTRGNRPTKVLRC
jgi:hypothetical protein